MPSSINLLFLKSSAIRKFIIYLLMYRYIAATADETTGNFFWNSNNLLCGYDSVSQGQPVFQIFFQICRTN